jgi:iron(III) transport system ATP-binding protein
VLVTHDQAEALSAGREVAVLRDGRIVQAADPEALYGSPADLDVARFVGDAVVLSGYADSGSVHCALGKLSPVHACGAGPVTIVVRPEQMELRPARSRLVLHGDESARLGTVTNATFFGSQTIVEVRLDGSDQTTVTVMAFSHRAPDVGARVEVVVSEPVLVYPSGLSPSVDVPCEADRNATGP